MTYDPKEVSDRAIEREMNDKGLNAPRVTTEQIDALIKDEKYYVFPGTTVTIALLTLENGFSVTGESAAADERNFDAEIGQKIARQRAYDKIWMLEGYVLKNQLITVRKETK